MLAPVVKVHHSRDGATVLASGSALTAALGSLIGAEKVLPGTVSRYLDDATETRGVHGRADAICLPATAEEVRRLVEWCYAHDLSIVPRGGGTGYAGGAVPIDGGVVIVLEGLARVRRFDPLLWRIEVEAGMRTARLRDLAHEHGLLFPPDPGAAEQSQIGGNIATNAGGPHALKYGTTGAWVTGLELVVAPGELVRLGGPVRKDVASYDLKSLIVGSEGTLGIVTAAWLRLTPRPAARAAAIAFYPTSQAGCTALHAVLGTGIEAAAMEFFDAGALAAVAASYPGRLPADTGFALLVEVDGSVDDVQHASHELHELLTQDALRTESFDQSSALAALWRWREGVSHALIAQHGGKVSEDIAVPLDRLAEAIEGTVAIGQRHGLQACSFGHAGDGNLHSTFLVNLDDTSELDRSRDASADLFTLAVDLGGTISGEHGIGWLKQGHLPRQHGPRVLALHRSVKDAFDPKHLFNPDKKGTGAILR